MPPPRQPERTRPRLPSSVYRDLKAASGAQLDTVAIAFADAGEALVAGDVTRAITLLNDAKKLAPRSAVVRESLGIALYLDGQFRQAGRELAAYRRMSGGHDQNHLLADCARANGQPERAEELVDEMIAADVAADRVAEGLLVVAGARADRGDPDAALAALHRLDLEPQVVEPYHLRLWYLAADLEEQRGDLDAAQGYLRAIATVDPGFLDVSERLEVADVDDHSAGDSASKRLRQ